MRKSTIGIAFILLTFITSIGKAQEIKPRGYFHKDTIKVGEPVLYSFSIRYPSGAVILMPDSGFNFTPFEFLEKVWFPTKTKDGISYDSVVYTLTTFELDSTQLLRTPIYLMNGEDSTAIFSDADSIYLQHVIPVVTDSTDYKANTEYYEVDYEFNYPYFLIGLAMAFLVIVILVLVFGKAVQKKIALYRLKKSHQKYEKEYQNALYQYKGNNIKPEEVLYVWKKYLENLEKKPYTKLTTKEIAILEQKNQDILRILRPIDRSIYGKTGENQLDSSFVALQKLAEEKYKAKVEEVQHA